jgi:hypothetical protein
MHVEVELRGKREAYPIRVILVVRRAQERDARKTATSRLTLVVVDSI